MASDSLKQEPQTANPNSDLVQSMRFLEDVIDILQNYSVSTGQMRITLEGIAHGLGLHGQFFITPDYVQAVVWGANKDLQQTYMSISPSGNYNLSIVAEVDKIVDEVITGKISVTEGRHRISKIDTRAGYSDLLVALAFVLCGAGFSLIIGGSIRDMFLAGFVSLFPYVITRIAVKNHFFTLLNELLSALSVTLVTIILANMIPGFNMNVVIFGALVTLIPGFSLTMASSEIVNKNSISGLIWLTKAILSAFQLVGGYAMGSYFGASLGFDVIMQSPQASIPPVWLWFAVVFLVYGLGITMNVAHRSMWAVILGGMAVWGAMQIGNLMGFWQGTFMGAAAMMLFAHWVYMRFKLPNIVILLPCVMLLVPGLSALQALYIGGEVGIMQGFEEFYNVLVLVASIIGGVVIGGTLVNPRHTLTRKYLEMIRNHSKKEG
ncbi:threonine/serine ThrE exporter family protein [Fulvivirga sedimenti]|uniref:Threonine/serine exporter family protein n=1 Tax=Fulvivirga sedimenti TaxID=2879465 RepID=A0A9X1HMT2_9BACT|nr:threonine/serine exporter family protein [Fulvivirga sedimenti]MCA6073467.1 threonine/serine exporter family protein [Fulvivirga sedimenti]